MYLMYGKKIGFKFLRVVLQFCLKVKDKVILEKFEFDF